MSKVIYLSHFIDTDTPTYGNREKFKISKKSNIDSGNIANNSEINTTVHIGTHIDMPYHFYKNGQTIIDFKPDFWLFNRVLVIEIKPKSYILFDEVVSKLNSIDNVDFELLIIKTSSDRREQDYMVKNIGLSPKLYKYLSNKYLKLRVIGFDTVSVSSFTDRETGREAHKEFLNPIKPILLLEDMNLSNVEEKTAISEVIVSPMLIKNSDGLPCTVLAKI